MLQNTICDVKMKGLSKKETEMIAELEYEEKYYFRREDISHHFQKDSQMRHTLHKLLLKKRIISLNKNKYYLIPIKAKNGKWADDAFRMADEICDSKEYFIGGWAAANYWKHTDQIPMKIEIFTTKRQGMCKILNNMYIFRRTTHKRLKEAVTRKRRGHKFKVLNKEASQKWLGSRA